MRRPLHFVLLSTEYWFVGISILLLIVMLNGHCAGGGSAFLACVTGQTGVVRTGFAVIAVGYIFVAYLLRTSGEDVWRWWLGERVTATIFALVAVLFLVDKLYIEGGAFGLVAASKVAIAVLSRRKGSQA